MWMRQAQRRRKVLSWLEVPFFTGGEASCRTQKGTPNGVGVHTDETGAAEDDLDMTGSDGDVDFDRRGLHPIFFPLCV